MRRVRGGVLAEGEAARAGETEDGGKRGTGGRPEPWDMSTGDTGGANEAATTE